MEETKEYRDWDVHDIGWSTTKKSNTLDNLAENVHRNDNIPTYGTVRRLPILRSLVVDKKVERVEYQTDRGKGGGINGVCGPSLTSTFH